LVIAIELSEEPFWKTGPDLQNAVQALLLAGQALSALG